MVPLVKNKAGNLSDINSYRAIAFSPALSKLFECLLEKYIHSYDAPDDFQFGFKSGLSASTALMFSSRLSITSQTEVHRYLYALLISQKLLIELTTGHYLTSYWMTILSQDGAEHPP